jgi:hypothetical protein
MPTAIEGLETFTLGEADPEVTEKQYDADSLFKVPASGDEDEDEDAKD